MGSRAGFRVPPPPAVDLRTASILDRYAGKHIFGYQALVGVDYALSDSTSLGGALRWTRFDEIDHEAVYNVVRSRAGRTRRRRDAVQQRAGTLRHRLSGTDRQPEVPLLKARHRSKGTTPTMPLPGREDVKLALKTKAARSNVRTRDRFSVTVSSPS